MSKKRTPPYTPARRRAREAMDPVRLRQEPAPEGAGARAQFEEDYPGPSQPAGNSSAARPGRPGGR
jgi:hypothetical protein